MIAGHWVGILWIDRKEPKAHQAVYLPKSPSSSGRIDRINTR
jgi:hypothetical protein